QLVVGGFPGTAISPSAPIPIDVASDGTFTVPAGALAWQGTGDVPAQILGQTAASCETFTISTTGFSETVSLGATNDAAGSVNPSLNTAHIGVDGSMSAADVTIPVALDA